MLLQYAMVLVHRLESRAWAAVVGGRLKSLANDAAGKTACAGVEGFLQANRGAELQTCGLCGECSALHKHQVNATAQSVSCVKLEALHSHVNAHQC